MRTENNSRFKAAAVFALAAFLPLRGVEVSEWSHRQAVPVERTGVLKFALPPATLDLARPRLEDLRLLDPAGQETPFVLEYAAPSTPPSSQRPRSFRVTLADAFTQVLIETGATDVIAGVLLASPAAGFVKAARVEVSEDGERWDVIETGAPLFRQYGAELLTLRIERRAAYIRVTIDDNRSRPIPFTGATLAVAAVTQPPAAAPLPIRILRREEFAGETLLTLDLGARHVPLAELEFSASDPLFARNVTVTVRELRDDTAGERPLARGAIYRVAADGLAPRSQLRVPLDFTAPSRELLAHIANQDSPPLLIEEVRATQRPVWLVFRAATAGAYTLLTGNATVAAPRYDLASLALPLRETTPTAIMPGAPELNPGHRRPETLAGARLLGAALDPAPWSYRKTVGLIAGGIQQLELDVDVLARAQAGFADLRLVRDRAQIPYVLERSALSRATPLRFTAADDPRQPRLSRWELKLARPGLPLSRIKVSSPTTLFQRRFRLFERIADDRGGAYERLLAEADWSKTPGVDSALLMIPSATPKTDTLLLETDNGDNPAILLSAIEASHPVTRLFFKTEPGPLELYYGNAAARAPRYDLSLVAGQILTAEKITATLGAEEKTTADRWGAGALAGLRGGGLFWGALGLVVLGLLAVVVRLLPKPPAPP